MSGLFATLVAAAQGRAPVLLPAVTPEIAAQDWSADIAWEEAEAGAGATELRDARPSRARGDAASSNAEVTGRATEGTAATARGRAPVPLLEPVAGPTATVPRVAAWSETKAADFALPYAPSVETDDGVQARAKPLPAPRPLLPRAAPRDDAPVFRFADDPAVPRHGTADVPTEPTLRLTIGRIELRPAPVPAPAAARPPAATVVTRPVALPRAAVRQSLDDYRSRQRK